jgi:hypothetical protein
LLPWQQFLVFSLKNAQLAQTVVANGFKSHLSYALKLLPWQQFLVFSLKTGVLVQTFVATEEKSRLLDSVEVA